MMMMTLTVARRYLSLFTRNLASYKHRNKVTYKQTNPQMQPNKHNALPVDECRGRFNNDILDKQKINVKQRKVQHDMRPFSKLLCQLFLMILRAS